MNMKKRITLSKDYTSIKHQTSENNENKKPLNASFVNWLYPKIDFNVNQIRKYWRPKRE